MNQAERFRRLTDTDQLRADLPARSVRAAALTAASGFADFALRIGSTALLARLILPEHFGLVMMATAVTAIADQLRDLGLSSATVQRQNIAHAEVTNLFWINVAVGALMTGVLCAASPAIAAYYHEPRLAAIACILASTLFFGGLTVQHQALLTRQLRLGRTAAVRLASSTVSTALAIGLALAGWGYWALLWREVARAALLAGGMWLSFPWLPGLPSRRVNVRPLLGFGANLTAANILASFCAGVDRFLLGRFWGAEPVAMYRQAFQLISAPTDQLLSPLYQVTQPCLSMLQTDAARYRRFYAKVVTLVCTLTMPLSLFVAVNAHEVTRLLLGPRWNAAVPILAILSVGTFMKQAIASTSFVPITLGNGSIYLRLAVLQNAVLVVLMAIGVRWASAGIAVADVATTYLLVGPRLRYNLRRSPVASRDFVAATARPAAASIAMGVVLFALHSSFASFGTIGALAAASVIGTIVFAAVWLLLPGGAAEARTLWRNVRAGFERRAVGTPAAASVTVALSP